MTTSRQMETVRRQVEEALSMGAVIHAQAHAPEGGPGQFLPAMVLTRVDHSMTLMREESFGPVVGVMEVDDMEEAVRLANDSDLGLTGSVWSRDGRKAEALGRRIKAGVITLNDHLMSHGLPETPWGGFKASGIGRTHGRMGFDEMTQPQVVVKDVMPFIRRDMWWHPHGEDVYEGIKGVLHALYGRGLLVRLRGAVKMVRLFARSFRP
jgi:succinate-semialdehyde dehydrogenase/glutarate-semialdehyde dehydrogenase